jgi:putative ABC transport system ATP-binding protein
MPLIEIEQLGKIYKGEVETPVLHDINFTIEDGEFVAIMGPSGSGKSTLLHILGFLDEPTSGTYRFQEKEFEKHNKKEMARIRNEKMGFVFQTFNLLPRMSVFQNVRLPLLYSHIPQSQWDLRVKKTVTSVGLEHRSDFETLKLSGGERQRTAIARALINKPKIIFADEPTGNLDSKTGISILEIFKNLNKKEGHTIILITHEREIAEYARRIIHIHDGMVVKDESLRKHHKHQV